jgi:signal transduction histidine kinase
MTDPALSSSRWRSTLQCHPLRCGFGVGAVTWLLLSMAIMNVAPPWGPLGRAASDAQTVAAVFGMLLCTALAVGACVVAVGYWLRSVQQGLELDAARAQALAGQEQATDAARDKSKFLGMLGHELLTPLQSIVSSMELIESRGTVTASDPLFMRLREGARALRARMSDLIDFARMTAGRLEVSPRKFRVDRLVEEVIADHEEAVVRKDLDVHWEPGDDLQQTVVTDPRRVRQILDNLLSNAIKYTERGGVAVEATLDTEARMLRLEVRDTGIGMATEQLERVFDPFYRVASSAQMAEGSGLGLAVVRSLVDLLKGRLEVDSHFGEGTRVVVLLPVDLPGGTAVAPAAPANATATDTAATPLTQAVLIVDDAHDARTGVAGIVRRLGCVPFEAGGGHEALRALNDRSYLAVLLDIDLPDLDGVSVAKQLRAQAGPNRGAWLIMLSASPPEDALSNLFDQRLDKPVSEHQLNAALQLARVRRALPLV